MSRTARAAATLALVIGFYVLALAMVVVLLSVPYWQLAHMRFYGIKLGIACLAAAWGIIYGIWPRREPDLELGPTLAKEDQPELFSMLEEIASATGQSMPATVYLLPDTNAFVAQQGGFLGIGSRRIMGIGLPLVALLTEKQLRAVIAHEFGHFEAGDTKLAVISAQGHRSIARTVGGLEARDSFLLSPMIWYGRLFTRAMNAISRAQEFTADALAAKAVGARELMDGLTRVHRGGFATVAYWQQEVVPLLSSGYLPPLAEGFSRFVQAPRIVSATDKSFEQEQGEQQTPDSTHPPLAKRLSALEALARADSPGGPGAPAVTLFRNLRKEEQKLAEFLMETDARQIWKLIPWENAAEQGYLGMWRTLVAGNESALQGRAISDLPQLCADPSPIIHHLKTPEGLPPQEHLKGRALSLLAAALGVRLYELGWKITAEVGESITLRRDAHEVKPSELVRGLAEHNMTLDEFIALELPAESLLSLAKAQSA